MGNSEASVSHSGEVSKIRPSLARAIGGVAVVAFGGVLVGGYIAGREKLAGIVLFGFLAMVAGVALQRYGQFTTPRQKLWAYGLASGAMLASAAALLAPKAIGPHPKYGGFAIAFGYLLGYAGHELGHLFTHQELPVNATVSELTLHATMAGSIMGVVYGTLPSLTPLFGYGIVAHKLPAGFGGAEALDRDGLPVWVMALPAAAVGLAAVPLSLATPDLGPIVRAVFYGVSTGVFAHVALDMIPECTGGGAGHGHGTVSCDPHADRNRHHAVASTVAGAGVLFVAWQLLAAL
ncbi:ZIP family metal transporter [Halapricum sp. CBA1109]|uniref:ZIP family metal transporter n=1 Tax=Halapricum sp. CBA1109 TaxID=2668068 RepID=UPI0012FB0C4E|nr:ZIP family metal transporter [Halapricum sp. CBA1109]MUV90876.1 ZIP family metal transporter [Halapricum sp. CBA1109]